MTARSVSNWLFGCAFMVFVMVVLGGLTRLTNSGLSMVDWHPITGILPPLSTEEWAQVFELYKKSPEFLKINYDMDLEGFKSIFWLEYIHRVWGRLIGLVFFVPLVLFAVKKVISPKETIKFVFIFLLGAAQGLLGWYMVKSGLIDNPHVSPYRLTAHLGAAFLLFSMLIWQALKYSTPHLTGTNRLPWASLSLVSITIIYGALVAGHKAGYLYNTFPKMGAEWIPSEIFFHTPWYTNLLGNPVTVQLIHRILAIVTFMYLNGFVYSALKQKTLDTRIGISLLVVTWAQFFLGIATLLSGIDIALATLHQANALVLLGMCVFVAFFVKRNNTRQLSSL